MILSKKSHLTNFIFFLVSLVSFRQKRIQHSGGRLNLVETYFSQKQSYEKQAWTELCQALQFNFVC